MGEMFVKGTKLVLVMASVTTGILLMVAMLAVLILKDPVPPPAAQAARTILSLGAGLTAAGLVGSLNFSGPVQGISLTATGGFGVFLVVYLIEPGVIGLLGLSVK